jgi:hypothetical protein
MFIAFEASGKDFYRIPFFFFKGIVSRDGVSTEAFGV